MERIVLLLLIGFAIIGKSYSQILIEEPFDYGAREGYLIDLSTSWLNHYPGRLAQPIQYIPENLELTGYAPENTSTTGMVKYLIRPTEQSQSLRYDFPEVINSGKIYSSFLIKMKSAPSGDGIMFMHTSEDASSIPRLGVYSNGDDTYGVKLWKSSAFTDTYGTFEFDKTYLIVTEYNFRSALPTSDPDYGSDVYSAWVLDYPATSRELAGTPTVAQFNGSQDRTFLDGVAIRQNGTSSAPDTVWLDALRVGRNWSDIINISNPLAIQAEMPSNLLIASTNDNPIYSLRILNPPGTSLSLNSITYQLDGDYSTEDIKIGGIKLYYSTDENFDPTEDVLIKSMNAVASGQSLVIDQFTPINVGNIGYLFLTADISETPTGNNTIAVSSVPTNQILTESGAVIQSLGADAGAGKQHDILQIPPSELSTLEMPESFSYTSNIDYRIYQRDLVETSAQGVEILQFIINDGGGTNDADELPTVIKDLTLNLYGVDNLRSIALGRNGALIPNSSIPATASVSYNDIHITVADGDIDTVNVYVTFSNKVEDNQQVAVALAQATVSKISSKLASDPTTLNLVSATTGDINRVEVKASRISHNETIPQSMTSGKVLPFGAKLYAVDALMNIDRDFNGMLTVSSTADVEIAPSEFNFEEGEADLGALTVTSSNVSSFSLKLETDGLPAFTTSNMQLIQPSASPGSSYYFSSSYTGDDSNGTEAAPYKSLDAISQLTLAPGNKILLKRGDRFPESTTLVAEGTSMSPIEIRPYGNESDPMPEVTGLVEVTGAWEEVSEGIYKTTCSSCANAVKQVLVNGSRKTLARYPNSGWLAPASQDDGTNSFNGEPGKGDNYWQGAEAVVKFRAWAIEKRTISNYNSATGQISYDMSTVYGASDWYGYYLQNKLEELDHPDEWFYDIATSELYLYATSAEELDNSEILVSTMDYGFNFQEGSTGIIIDGIRFTGQNQAAVNAIGSQASPVAYFSVQNCEFENLNNEALNIEYGNKLQIHNSEITNCADNGIDIINSSESVISNNKLYNIGFEALAPESRLGGIEILEGVGIKVSGLVSNNYDNVIKNNHIDSVGYSGIIFVGENNRVVNNFIANFCWRQDDGGGIYSNDLRGGNPEEFVRGTNFIIGNVIENGIGAPESKFGSAIAFARDAHGIYMDQFTTGFIIRDNHVSHVTNGIMLNASDLHIITNNVVYGAHNGISMNQLNAGEKIEGVVISNNTIFSVDPDENTLRLASFTNDLSGFNFLSQNNKFYNPYNPYSVHLGYRGVQNRPYFLPVTVKEFKELYAADNGSTGSDISYPLYQDPELLSEDLIKGGDFEGTNDLSTTGFSIFSEIAEATLSIVDDQPLLDGQSMYYDVPETASAGSRGALEHKGLNIDNQKVYLLSYEGVSEKAIGLTTRIYNPSPPYARVDNFRHAPLRPDTALNNQVFIRPDQSFSNSLLRFETTIEDGSFWMDNIQLYEIDPTLNYYDPEIFSPLLVNGSLTSQTFSLDDTYLDLNYNPVSSVVTLPPLSSKILIKSSDCQVVNNLQVELSATDMSQAVVSFDLLEQVDSLTLFYKPESASSWQHVSLLSPTIGSLEMSLEDLQLDSGYELFIRTPCTAAGARAAYGLTEPVHFFTGACTISNLQVVFEGENAPLLTWNAENAIGFNLSYKPENDQEWVDSLLSADSFQFLLPELEELTTYLVELSSQCSANIYSDTASTTFTSQGVLGLDKNNMINYLIYPVPARNMLMVQTKDIDNSKIYLVNIKGEVLDIPTTRENGQLVLDVHRLSSGIYFLKINQKEKIVTQKILIE